MPSLEYYNIRFSKAEGSNDLLISGEVKNGSGRNYNAIAVRIILFHKQIPLVNVVVLINGLVNGQTKHFQKSVEEISYDQMSPQITRYEAVTDSAY